MAGMMDRVQELALDTMAPLVGARVTGLLQSNGGFTGLKFDDGRVLWIEQDTEGNGPGHPRVEKMADQKFAEPPPFPAELIGCEGDCGFIRAGAGYQCKEGDGCGRYVHPGDRGFAELDAYHKHMTAPLAEPKHIGPLPTPRPHPGDTLAMLRYVEKQGGCSLRLLGLFFAQPQAVMRMNVVMAVRRGQATMSPTGRSIRVTDAGREAIAAGAAR
jgi:hypothetical protein